MLSDRAMWKKWASRDTLKPANWGPLPVPPEVHTVVPLQQLWHFTTAKPAENWTKPDSTILLGKKIPPGSARTARLQSEHRWATADIWLRREITVPEGTHNNLQFVCFHDEDVQNDVNGILAAEEAGFVTSYVPMEISKEAREQMKPGAKILVAVHCHQTVGGQGIDVGMADVAARVPSIGHHRPVAPARPATSKKKPNRRRTASISPTAFRSRQVRC